MKYEIMYRKRLLWLDLFLCTLWLWSILGGRDTWLSPAECIALVAVFMRIASAFLLPKDEIRTLLPLGIMSACLGLLAAGGIFPRVDTLVRYPFIVNGIEQVEQKGYMLLSILIVAWLWGLPVIFYLVQLIRKRLKRRSELTWSDLFGAILWKDPQAQLYTSLLLISLTALYAGLSMNPRMCHFICLAAPPASYWLLCRYYHIKDSRTGFMLISMVIFYYAQATGGILRIWMLIISLTIIAYLGLRIFRKNLRWEPLLATILYIGTGLPSLAIGYNQYTGTDYARSGLYSLTPYAGIFFIKDSASGHYGLRDRYGILVKPEYKSITLIHTEPPGWHRQVELKKDGETDIYDLLEGKLYKNQTAIIPIEKRIINREEDLRAYFDSLCQHTEARLWIHRQDDPDTIKVWEAIDKLTDFARGEREAYPIEEVKKALHLMGQEQAYLQSHAGWQESTWNNESPNPGEIFLSRFLEKAAYYCPRIECLTNIYSRDKNVGVINFSSWSEQPFYSIVLYRNGKGLRTKAVIIDGQFSPTEITEITKLRNTVQNLYQLRSTNDRTYIFDIDRNTITSCN